MTEEKKLEWVDCSDPKSCPDVSGNYWQAEVWDYNGERSWFFSCIRDEEFSPEWTMRVFFIDDDKDVDEDENWQIVFVKKFNHKYQSVGLRQAKRAAESWARKLELL